jgi:hypothetical protein
MDVLMQAQHKASEALYKNQQSDAGAQGTQSAQGAQGAEGAQGAQDAQGAEQKSEGDVIDAEVVEDDKK